MARSDAGTACHTDQATTAAGRGNHAAVDPEGRFARQSPRPGTVVGLFVGEPLPFQTVPRMKNGPFPAQPVHAYLPCCGSPCSVDLHHAALERQHAVATDRGLGAFGLDGGVPLNHDLWRFERDLGRLDLDAAAADLQLDGRARFGDVLARGDRDRLVACFHGERVVAFRHGGGSVPLFDGERVVSFLDRRGSVLPDLDGLASIFRLAVAHDQLLVVVDLDRLVAFVLLLESDLERVVVLHDAIEVFFGVEVDLLRILFVLESQFVKRCGVTLLRAARLDATLRHVAGQRIGRHVVGVVDATRDDRPIRVSFQKIDDDFLSDARDMDATPRLAGPQLGDADPAGTVFVGRAVAVPMELDFDTSILVGPDFLAGRSDDDGSLGSLDHGFGSETRRPISGLTVDGREAATAHGFRIDGPLGFVSIRRHRVVCRHQQVLAILVRAGMIGECEQPAGGQTVDVPSSLHLLPLRLLFFDACLGVKFAIGRRNVLPGIIEDLVIGNGVPASHRLADGEIDLGSLEVEIPQCVRAGLHLPGNGPLVDVVSLAAGLGLRGIVGHLFVPGQSAWEE